MVDEHQRAHRAPPPAAAVVLGSFVGFAPCLAGARA
jgi:hypothetical protein